MCQIERMEWGQTEGFALLDRVARKGLAERTIFEHRPEEEKSQGRSVLQETAKVCVRLLVLFTDCNTLLV